ncbi:MAG: ethanolamine ammonia-lyase reactivating factor EutA [Candidatus Heimdallarchaeota archaeon]|nr:ethanolamine ammonia-lyase reactivating factor EutA [Candidatus Heimdallarchaeota archaeon]
MFEEIEQIDLLSVGIDVGSSTSHLVFSNLVLRRDETTPSRRFTVFERDILYEGRIINTPLLDEENIDIEKISEFFKEEYKRANIKPEDINTGAVIVTGETAKKHNAKEIVEKISKDAGKFVAATAGPNFESYIAAFGSGMTVRSKKEMINILTVDIGGGTSNMAIIEEGQVVSTACVSVGGRLLAVNDEGVIWRIDKPAQFVLQELGYKFKVGDIITLESYRRVAARFAEILIEVITKPTESTLAGNLMRTSDLNFDLKIDEYAFTGGVGELIYREQGSYQDMGHLLAVEINRLVKEVGINAVEPENKIRATVIGAGAYSLSISGSTGFLDKSVNFPLKNVPIIRVDIDRSLLSIEHVKQQVDHSFNRFDLLEGEEIVALYFKDPVRASYEQLKLFGQAIEASLPNSIAAKIPLILIFERDIANSVGNIIRRETNIKDNLLSIDELFLEELDFIDIGTPLVNGQVFPVTVKSLVFNTSPAVVH